MVWASAGPCSALALAEECSYDKTKMPIFGLEKVGS
jgi:hypothetical protein